MEIEFSSAKTYEAFQKIERKVDALKALFRDVAEVKNKCERVVLAANRRIGAEIASIPKAASAGPGRGKKTKSQAREIVSGRAGTGIKKDARSRLQKLSAIPEPVLDSVVTKIQDAGKDATTTTVLRVVRDNEIQAKKAAYAARAERGGTVKDLVALAASGKRFAVIYADPPWKYETYSAQCQGTAPAHHYDVMTDEAIMGLPVAPLAAKDCVLFLWVTWPKLVDGIRVIEAWGFQYKTCGFNWYKLTKDGDGLASGQGYWTRANSEVCLLATRGSPQRVEADVHQVIMTPRGAHSEKPAEARRRIERLVLGPYLELFARQKTDGWFAWGNEIPTEEDPPIRRRRGRPPKTKTQLEAAE